MTRLDYQLDEARWAIGNGDVLLFRGRGKVARLISTAGRSEYTHAAMAQWRGEELWCLEVREFKGGRAVTLASQVEKYPGLVDVFRVNSRWLPGDWNPAGAVEYMRMFVGCEYGYWSLVRAALLHAAVWRLWVRPETDDEALDDRPPFCSEAVAQACRIGGGVDPVPHLADRITEPGDLSRSQLFATEIITLWPSAAGGT